MTCNCVGEEWKFGDRKIHSKLSLFARNTSVVYEGKPVGTPDSAQFFRVIEEHKVASTLLRQGH